MELFMRTCHLKDSRFLLNQKSRGLRLLSFLFFFFLPAWHRSISSYIAMNCLREQSMGFLASSLSISTQVKPLKSAQSCGDWSSHVLVLILTMTNKRGRHGGWTWKDLNLLPWHWIWCQVPSTGNAVPPNNYIPQYFWNPRSFMLLLPPS